MTRALVERLSSLEVLHVNCVCCRSDRDRLSPVEATLVILHMLGNDCTAEGIARDLCFVHRRMLDRAKRHRDPT